MNNIADLKKEFIEIVNKNIHREGIADLMAWLETTDFYTAPSSARFHGAEEGGLVAHCISVYKYLKNFQEFESDETIAIAALFHDLCKVGIYKVSMRNTKDASGKWIQVPYYDYRDDEELPVGHGEKSVIILMKYMKLTDQEICAIRWHMGGYVLEPTYERPAISKALSLYKLVLKLQTADQASSFWEWK